MIEANGVREVNKSGTLTRLHPRPSAQAIREALRTAEIEFGCCQRIVSALSGYRVEETTGEDVIGFQMRLYKAIADLEQVYRQIKREEKRLIREKARFKPHWFSKRMAQLAAYTRHVREGLTLGRAIGDGFAWFFYERDPQLIDEHLKLQPQLLFPPDLGAAGERVILERVRSIDGKMLIYHGVTSFLRIGDISLVDLKTMRVSCIGELKTSRIDPNRIKISVSMVAGEREQLPKFPTPESSKQNKLSTPLSSAMQARLTRQKKVMEESIARARKMRSGIRIDSESDFLLSRTRRCGEAQPLAYFRVRAGRSRTNYRGMATSSTSVSSLKRDRKGN